jgi:hypothetical protein
MKLLLIALTMVASLSEAGADVITKGTKFAEAQKAFAKANYAETGLDMEPRTRDRSLGFWAVDEGVLIVSYSTTSGLIESISFTVMDERPKATRKAFWFSVVSFDTETGALLLSTKKPK